jgi:cyclic pyranopterin phosphate synthase
LLFAGSVLSPFGTKVLISKHGQAGSRSGRQAGAGRDRFLKLLPDNDLSAVAFAFSRCRIILARMKRNSGEPSRPVLTHQAEDGRARMVDIGAKPETARMAVAEGLLRVSPQTVVALRTGQTPKGDPLLVSQVAGIQAAKRTAELIPLCHPLALTQIDLQLDVDESVPGVRARATARVHGRTGVEMEALTAVTVALLTAYDMLKGVDRQMSIEAVRVSHKEGGRSGSWNESGTAGGEEKTV